MEWMTQNMDTMLWLALALFLFIVEASTTQMICIWFSIGGFATAIAAALGLEQWAQFILFVATSGVALLLTRRFVKNVLKVKKVPTNADSVIGLTGVVLVEIDNVAETGRVRVNGLDWSARNAEGDEKIGVGQRVLVKEIQGVKVMVEALEVRAGRS